MSRENIQPQGCPVVYRGFHQHGVAITLTPHQVIELRKANLKTYNRVRREYEERRGKRYTSTVKEEDILTGNTKKFVFSTSTLAHMSGFVRDSCNGLNMIAVPGGTINHVQAIADVELKACYKLDQVQVLVVAGLNNFMAGVTNMSNDYQPVDNIVQDMRNLKERVKRILPNCTFDAIPLPLIPKLCCSQFEMGTAYVGGGEGKRSEDILFFNRMLRDEINDTPHSVSLEDAGIVKPTPSKFWYFPGFDKKTGVSFVCGDWRQTEFLPRAVHLSDSCQRAFWYQKVVPYFAQ